MEQALYPYIRTEDKLHLTEVCRSWRYTFKHALHLNRTCDRLNFAKIWNISDLAENWENAWQSNTSWVDYRYRRYWHRGRRMPIFPRSVEALVYAGN